MARMTEQPRRRQRIEVRVTDAQDALIRHAAELEDRTVTAFILAAVTARAKSVVKDHNTLVLSNEAFDRFLAELDGSPKAVPELVELFRDNPPIASS